MRFLRIWIVVLMSFTLSACTSWFFFPSRAEFGNPSEAGIRYRDVFLPVDENVTVHGWLLEPDPGVDDASASQRRSLGSVYFLHGNAENISSHSRAIYWLVKAGYEVFALDYRGYGQSEGHPDLPEVFDDIEAGAQWLVEHRQAQSDDSPLFLLGQSLGASLAIKYAASKRTHAALFDAIVVEAAFTSYGEIARKVASGQWLTWLFQWPAQWMLSGPFDPVDSIGELSPTPVLIIHSTEDEIIPFEHGEQLYREALEPRQFVAATGRHISAFADSDVREQVLKFMSAVQ